MDTFFPPELMPDHPTSTLSKEMDLMSRGEYGLRRAFTRVSAFCILFLPALIYRWSLKATSVIYAPLVFIVHTTFRNVRDLRKKLELLKRSDVARIRVAYGIIFIAAFTVKIALMNKLSHFADWWNGHPITELLALYIAPGEIPKWQLASLINSFLALIAMFFVRAALTHIEVGCPWPELAVNRVLGFITAVRWPLAIYTILSMAYITMQAARGWKWPMLGTKWFPW